MNRILKTFPCGRLVAFCLAALLALPLPLAAAPQQLPDAPAPQARPAAAAALPTAQRETAMAEPPLSPYESSSSAQQGGGAQDADQNQQGQPQKPVGTAAGPVTRPTGIAGASPSGAAIAPAKQRRVKAFFIRASIILAAAGAAGAVIALSHASPSRPQ